MKANRFKRAWFAILSAGGLLAGSTANGALNIHYTFEGLDPVASVDVPNSAPGASVNGTIMNPDKTVAVSGNIVTVGGASYTLGTSISFTSGDAENAEAGHVDTGFLPTDLGVTNANVWNRDYTMMGWVNFASTSGDNFVFGQLSGEVLHHGSRNGFLHSAHWGDDIGPDQGVNVGSLPGTWHHLAYVNEGQAQSIYRDGELVVGPGATGANANNGGTNVVIGTSLNNGSFRGQVDEIKIFGDEALTQEQIVIEMTAGLTPYNLARLTAATLSATTYTLTFSDSATSIVDLSKTKSLSIDDAVVTGSATFNKAGAVTTVTYTPAVAPDPGSLHTFAVTVTDNVNNAINGAGSVRPPYVSNTAGGGTWDTEMVWTAPTTMNLVTAEEALNDPSPYPPENFITVKTEFIHFDEGDAGAPLFALLSQPYPLFDPINGGPGRGGHEDFAIRCRGQIKILKEGTCWFICNSDDGFSLRIDGTEVGFFGDRARGNTVMSVPLTAGVHDVEFVHWERGGGAGVSVYVHNGVSDTEPPFDEDSYALLQTFLDPTDTDGDGMVNTYELANGLNPAVDDAALDKDGDGLTNLVESQRNTRADKPDTDDDGLNDKIESGSGTFAGPNDTGTNPRLPDTDGDGLNDKAETNSGNFISLTDTGSSPFKRDTDSDGVGDAAESANGTNPSVANTGFDFGLVGYWPLDTDYNSAVNGHTATANGTVLPIPFAPGKFGNGVQLDGVDQFLQVDGDENVFDFNGQNLTISAWFTADTIDKDWQCLVAKGEGNGWRIHRRGADQPPELAYGGGAGDVAKHSVPMSVGDGTIHHVVAISESGVNERLYFDGVMVATGGPPTLENRANAMRIGANPDTSPGRFWTGLIDELALWSRVLSDIEIGQIYNGGQGTSIQQLLGPVVPQLRFTQVLYNKATDQFTLTWTSSPGEIYTLNYSINLTAFTQNVSTTIASGGTSTSFGPFANPTPGGSQIFFKATEN